MKTMEHNTNTPMAIMLGMIGGLIKYFLQVNADMHFWQKILEAGGTAMICGFLGVLGKEMYGWIKKLFNQYLKKRKLK